MNETEIPANSSGKDYDLYVRRMKRSAVIGILSIVVPLAVAAAILAYTGSRVLKATRETELARKQLDTALAQKSNVTAEVAALSDSLQQLRLDTAGLSGKLLLLQLQLNDMTQENTGIQQTLRQARESLESEKKALLAMQGEIDSLSENIWQLRSIADTLQLENEKMDTLRKMKMDSLELFKDQLANLVERAANNPEATASKLKPVASSTPLGTRNSSGLNEYHFEIWLEGSQNLEKVVYNFNSKTFANPIRTSTDAADRFRVSYNGWGCLPYVVVTAYYSNGKTEEIVFDMCRALSDKSILSK